MSILNSLILFDSFISSGREFQILGPKNMRDCILYGVNNALQTVVLLGRKLALTNHNEDNVVNTSCVLEYYCEVTSKPKSQNSNQRQKDIKK